MGAAEAAVQRTLLFYTWEADSLTPPIEIDG